jgi:hypothetical protein
MVRNNRKLNHTLTIVHGFPTTRNKFSDESCIISAGYIASTSKCEKGIYEVSLLRNFIKNYN